jgi:hypothetical protein
VGEYATDPNAKNYHFTLGGPYFPEYDGCEGADEWWENFMEMNHAEESGLCGAGAEIRRIANRPVRPFRFSPSTIAEAAD